MLLKNRSTSSAPVRQSKRGEGRDSDRVQGDRGGNPIGQAEHQGQPGGGELTVFHWQLGSLDDKGTAGVAVELLDHLPRWIDRDILKWSKPGDQHLERRARGEMAGTEVSSKNALVSL